MKDAIYHTVMFLLRAAEPEYFRRILIDGRPCDDPSRHLIVVANHPFGVQDAFLLAYAYTRPFYFAATALNFQTRQGDRIKRRRLRGWFMRRCHVLPIIRNRAEGDMKQNLETFQTASARIAEGHALGIFAEGDSRGNQWNLLKLKAGAAEIALRVAEMLKQQNASVSIQVVGITYTDWNRPFKSTVTVKFAEPFEVDAVDDADRAAVRAARRDITGRMTDLMQQLTVQIPGPYCELSGKIAQFYAADYPDDYLRLKGVAAEVVRWAEHAGDERVEIQRLLDEYLTLADELRIYPGEERRRRNAVLLLLAALPAYMGFVIHWPILWGTRRLVPAEKTELHALGSNRVMCGILLTTGFYVTLIVTATAIGVWRYGFWGLPVALSAVTIVGACGLIASRALRHVNLLFCRWFDFSGRYRRYTKLGRMLRARLEVYRRGEAPPPITATGGDETTEQNAMPG